MTKIRKNILLCFLIIFSFYCSIIIGQTWDEYAEILKGNNVIEYLFSFGEIDNKNYYRQHYSPIYWSLLYIFTKQFPSNYLVESSHVINLIFSLSAIFGIAKLSQLLFNKKVSQITFLILFFYPIFFGHLSINNKDSILAICHVWITYLIFRYLKKQHKKTKINKYIVIIGILASIGSGIQLVFLGSLTPILIFLLFEIFLFKKIINNNFSKKKFLIDIIKSFVIFYFLLILFWIDTHQNIFVLPFQFILSTFSDSFWTGWPYNLVNGNYYFSSEVPKTYLLTNLYFKSPEYFLFAYTIFPIILLFNKNFFFKKFIFFNYKISFIIIILTYPILIFYIMPYPIYDGMRLFLWCIPYYCIIPSLTLYYLIENFNLIKVKLISFLFSILIVYFLTVFFLITPYQYTYLNIFNGKKENRYKKFENDYWGASIKELIEKSKFENNKTVNFSFCGVNEDAAKRYLHRKKNLIFSFVNHKNADYIIMTNRTASNKENALDSKKIINCFDKYNGENIFSVKRNGLTLSIIRKR